MRLAVLSDIHGNLAALDVVLKHLSTRAPDLVVNLGDCVSGPFWPRETCELLETLAMPTVRGNHDRWLRQLDTAAPSPLVSFTRELLTEAQCSKLANLPARLELDGDILAVHGTPRSDTSYLLEDDSGGRLALARAETVSQRLLGVTARLILCGHSHIAHSAMIASEQLILNPGSVGCPRYAFDDGAWHAEAGSPHARYAIATRRGRTWDVELIALAYEWSGPAQRARDYGVSDWADAFLR